VRGLLSFTIFATLTVYLLTCRWSKISHVILNRLPLPATLLLSTVTIIALACGDDSNGGSGVAFGLHSELVTEAERVSEIVVAPDGRILFAEQLNGNIRIVQADGTVQEQPFATLEVADHLGLDWGLTGLALDPDFESNHFVYAYFTSPDDRSEPPNGPTGHPAIVRFTDEDGIGADETVITVDFPVTPTEHPGFNGNGKIHFGPDGYLYASVGDYDDYANPDDPVRDLSTPIGKLLRVDPTDGSAPGDNPFTDDPDADARVFAYGFREPFDFAFHPDTGAIYGSDNTTVSCEEINIIEAGSGYGWPDGEFPYSECDVGDQGRLIYNPARDGLQPGDFLSFVEISGLAFTSASRYPTLGDSLVVCESWRSDVAEDGTPSRGVLRRLVLGGAESDSVTSSDEITRDCRGTVSVAPDGTIYYATDTEIRKLEVGGGDGGAAGEDESAPTQQVPPQPTNQ
jgi:glucose/arabinose dehydrogenase